MLSGWSRPIKDDYKDGVKGVTAQTLNLVCLHVQRTTAEGRSWQKCDHELPRFTDKEELVRNLQARQTGCFILQFEGSFLCRGFKSEPLREASLSRTLSLEAVSVARAEKSRRSDEKRGSGVNRFKMT